MPRSLTPVPSTWPSEDRITRFDFLIIYFTTGAEYWTNRPGESYLKDIGNGEGELLWDGTHGWNPGQFEQADQDPLSVSDVSFDNADYAFTDKMRAQGTYGVRGVRLDAWVGAFDKDDATFTTFYGSIPVWSGVMSRAEAVKDYVRVDMRPFSDPLSVKFPPRRYSNSHGFNWIPKVGTTLKIGTTVHKLPTTKPLAPGGGGGGGTGAPPPGNVGPMSPTGRQVIRADTRGRGTSTPRRSGANAGRDTRKVNR